MDIIHFCFKKYHFRWKIVVAQNALSFCGLKSYFINSTNDLSLMASSAYLCKRMYSAWSQCVFFLFWRSIVQWAHKCNKCRDLSQYHIMVVTPLGTSMLLNHISNSTHHQRQKILRLEHYKKNSHKPTVVSLKYHLYLCVVCGAEWRAKNVNLLPLNHVSNSKRYPQD